MNLVRRAFFLEEGSSLEIQSSLSGLFTLHMFSMKYTPNVLLKFGKEHLNP